jgi:alcohol dehydrogenase (NADP+)
VNPWLARVRQRGTAVLILHRNLKEKGIQMKFMQFRNGDQMPVLGLGTWQSPPGEVYLAVKEALRLGYRHIDCAFIYGNQVEIGQALSESFSEGVVSRKELWITSKLWNSFHAPADVQPALEKTLADLQLDYLDLYLMHWPVAVRKGIFLPESAADLIPLKELPLSDTWQALEKLTDKGLCRHIGVSNFSITKLKALLEDARIKPEMNQIELHPYLQQTEMLAFAKEHGIYLTAFAPLGSPGRPARLKVADEPVLMQEAAITTCAEGHGVTPAQVLISWAIQRGTVVIPKSVNPERLQQNLAAAELELTPEEIVEIDRLNLNRRYTHGKMWTIDGSPYTLANLWDE